MNIRGKYALFGNMRYMLSELRRFSLRGVLISFAQIPAKVSVSVAAIYVPKLVLDALSDNTSLSQFAVIIAVSTAIIAITSFIELFSRNTVDHCTNAFILTQMNRRWLEKATDMDYDAFTSESGKQKAEKARASLEGTALWGIGSYFPRLVFLVTSIAGFTAYGTILATLNPLILLLLILCYSASIGLTLYTEKKKHLLKDEIAKVDRRLRYNAYRTRDLHIGKDIRLYSMARWLREMARTAQQDKRRWDQKLADRQFRLMLINGILVFLRDGAAYAYLITLFAHSAITIGEFILYFGAITGLGEWLSRINTGIGDFAEANHYVTDFREFMDVADAMNREAKVLPPSPDEPASICLDGVFFAYQTETGNVLQDINLSIKAGEKLAIVGLNGAGKTTMVKLISGLVRPNEGRIFVNNVDIHQYARDDYYGMFSAVFQDSDVLPVSIADNIALNVGGEKDLARIQECIALVGLDEKVRSLPYGIETELVKQISEDGTELSGGEKQKLLLARALYKKASVIILDEPTAALDPISENELYQQFSTLIQGKTAIFISHRLSSTRFCDRIILIGGKSIIEVGTHDELMTRKGEYAALYEVQSKYYKKDAAYA